MRRHDLGCQARWLWILGNMTLVLGEMTFRRLDRLLIWLLSNTARAARQQTAYSMVSSLCGRHLKGKGKGFWTGEKCKECTRKEGGISTFTWWMFIMQKTIVTPGRHFPPSFPCVSLPLKNPLSFEMPATWAKWCKSISLPVCNTV